MNNSAIHTIIILAAGLGSRFEGSEHKYLVALQYGEGSLKRLLRQLKAMSLKCHIVIVTGHQADSLINALSEDFSNLNFVDNSNFYNGSLLESICVGLQTLTNEQGVWILFADTIYHNAALEYLLQAPTETITIACAPIDARQEDSIGISFRSDNSQLISIGPFIADMFDGIMIPAVFWPRSYWPTLINEAKKGIQSQWHVLQKVAIGHAKVVCLESDLVSDIDTRKDLMLMRNNLIGDQVFQYFKKFLSKDERSRSQPDTIQKNCFIK